MRTTLSRRWRPVPAIAGAVLLAVGGAAGAAPLAVTSVLSANPKTAGFAAANFFSPELRASIVAQGSMPLENPTADFPFYGYDGDGPMVPPPGAVQSVGNNVEASKTEPDKNTYLVLKGLHGADPGYDYGTHFLFQGHELGIKDQATGIGKGYLTRVNLDADSEHRVTLLATQDGNGNFIRVIDGSTWDPFAQRLLFTSEGGTKGAVYQATPDLPSAVDDLSGIFGRGGYEGIQNDSDGNLWVVEDVGGAAGSSGAALTHSKQANSFIYRFVPADPANLPAGGKLQALRVKSLAHTGGIVFHAGAADADILSQDEKDLHTYGKVFDTSWVTIHDTAFDGFIPFDANALAKAAGACPFKRPENGVFVPKAGFTQFIFDETGDTNAQTEAGSAYGGFGSLMKLTQQSPSADTGTLTLLFVADIDHTGFDNLQFVSRNQVLAVEDRGDTLHTQHNALDSGFIFDVTADYGNPATSAPVRFLAEGRDASATLDSALGSISGNGFQNDGDNEITGIHVSDGDPSVHGILGWKRPDLTDKAWRAFFTQQHGDNMTWEITLVK